MPCLSTHTLDPPLLQGDKVRAVAERSKARGSALVRVIAAKRRADRAQQAVEQAEQELRRAQVRSGEGRAGGCVEGGVRAGFNGGPYGGPATCGHGSALCHPRPRSPTHTLHTLPP